MDTEILGEEDFREGAFKRSFALPATVDATKIEATLNDGVLSVKLPMTLPLKSEEKKIQIK